MELNSVVFYDYLAFGFYMRRGLPNSTALPTYNMIMRKISG